MIFFFGQKYYCIPKVCTKLDTYRKLTKINKINGKYNVFNNLSNELKKAFNSLKKNKK